MAAADVTVVESGNEAQGIDPYRRRHAGLAGAGSFERLVAEGGMGAVILVRDALFSPAGPAVVKMIRDDLLADSETVGRFRRELANHHRLSQRLQVPRIVPCLAADPGSDPAQAFGAFPFYPDGTLADAVAGGEALTEGLRVVADVAEGLQSLHGLQVVHRDVCPQNIFVSREGGRARGVLGDLGVAVPLQANTIFTAEQVDSDLRFRTGHVGYIDPWHAGSVAGDLFSLGATLFWLLAGFDPPQGPAEEGLVLPAAAACRPGVPAALAAQGREVIARLTCCDPEARYRNAPEAREAIAALAELAQQHEAAAPSSGRALRGWGVAAAALVAVAVGWGVMSGLNGRADAPAVSTGEAGIPVAVDQPPEVVEAGPVESEAPREPAGPEAAAAAPIPPDLIRAASSLLGAGDAEGAESMLRDLLARYPNDPDGAGMLALVLSRQGGEGLAEAKAILAAALERSPARGDLRLTLARITTQMGEPGEAAEVLAAAPAATTHADEIESLAVTLRARAHRTP